VNYPFGTKVLACAASADSTVGYLSLGAYPSAFYIRWTPPSGYRSIAAIPVDNEPTPFWNGSDYCEIRQVDVMIGWDASWGVAHPTGGSNDLRQMD